MSNTKLQYENVFTTEWNKNLYARLYDPQTKTSHIEYISETDELGKPSKYITKAEIERGLTELKKNAGTNIEKIQLLENAKKTLIKTNLLSIPKREELYELKFNKYDDSAKFVKSFTSYSEKDFLDLYGIKSRPFTYIRKNYIEPVESDHKFHTLFLDIETLIPPFSHLDFPEVTLNVIINDKEETKTLKELNYLYINSKGKKNEIPWSYKNKEAELIANKYKTNKNAWKPRGIHGAKAFISSIQLLDTKNNKKIVYALSKDYTGDDKSIIFKKFNTEEDLLEAFIKSLDAINPTVIIGWNSSGYDIPFITNRVLRVLDNEQMLYKETPGGLKYNKELLQSYNVKRLSSHYKGKHFGIEHKIVKTNFGEQDEFNWVGYFLVDYLDMYKKYTYITHTSYSLDTVASYELGSNKVEHDEFTDFAEFFRNDFNTFIEYGAKDVELLLDLDNKLKLTDLAKYISYACGVNLNDVNGTLKQWNQFTSNEFLNKGLVLPLSGSFDKIDRTFLDRIDFSVLPNDRVDYFKNILGNNDLIGQSFAGGVTRGTGKFWKWVFSLDFTSLYPSNIMWGNIGIDSIILPNDLPQELIDLRAKYFIYYNKGTKPSELEKYDFEFIENVLRNEEAREEIRSVLLKHNVTATPNGMFFRKYNSTKVIELYKMLETLDEDTDEYKKILAEIKVLEKDRAIASILMERMIRQRKIYKKEMKDYYKLIEDLKKLPSSDANKNEIAVLSYKADKANTYQMGVKIKLNSYYGSLSLGASVSAGQSEFFSTAVTAVGRVANLFVTQEQVKLISKLSGKKCTETKYGSLNYMDACAQIDTDSVTYDSMVYKNGEKVKIGDLFETSSGNIEKKGKNNLIKHIEEDIITLSLNKEKGTVESKKIKYIMAHKVKKRMFRIKHNNDTVTVTEDHSVIIKRNNVYIDCKPKDIKKGDKIIPINMVETEDFIVEDLGIQEQWVYDLEVEDNHNFFANDICVHNSCYVSIEDIIIKKFGEDYEKTVDKSRLVEFTENYINKYSMPLVESTLNDIYGYTLNASMPEKLLEDPEVICDNFISIAPKMYFARKWWDEGLTLTNHKMKVTGLSMVRANTPKFFRQELAKAMEILIDGNIPKVIDFIETVRDQTKEQKPSQICINQSVSSLDYEWQETTKKYKRWVPEKNKWLSAPVNSRASLVHNKYIEQKSITEIKDIEAGDKIGFLELKVPNPTLQNVIAFNNEKVFDYGLDEYIDRNAMFEKGFLKSIHLITDPIGWSLISKDDEIDDEEW